MIIFGLSQEVWKLESKLETFQKQMEIKNVEMEKVNDKVTPVNCLSFEVKNHHNISIIVQ